MDRQSGTVTEVTDNVTAVTQSVSGQRTADTHIVPYSSSHHSTENLRPPTGQLPFRGSDASLSRVSSMSPALTGVFHEEQVILIPGLDKIGIQTVVQNTSSASNRSGVYDSRVDEVIDSGRRSDDVGRLRSPLIRSATADSRTVSSRLSESMVDPTVLLPPPAASSSGQQRTQPKSLQPPRKADSTASGTSFKLGRSQPSK
eukprot:Filipodium_phascolosomae@DN4180_c0_g1_i1.p1